MLSTTHLSATLLLGAGLRLDSMVVEFCFAILVAGSKVSFAQHAGEIVPR